MTKSNCWFLLLVVLIASASSAVADDVTVLYGFDSDHGQNPQGGLVRDDAGNLYGTTYNGGASKNDTCNRSGGCGVVFKLAYNNGVYTPVVLKNFCATSGCPDGSYPYGGLAMDKAGNLFGTASAGGQYGAGVVFELVHAALTYKYQVIYNFCSIKQGTFCLDGSNPVAGVVMDGAGNLYGTTYQGGVAGGSGSGVVFRLVPLGFSNWHAQILHVFCQKGPLNCPEGISPKAALVLDSRGNVYGTTESGGASGKGTVFQLAYGTWDLATLYSFCAQPGCLDGANPRAPVTFASNGQLYGTTLHGGLSDVNGGHGVMFALDPNNGWKETIVYLFCSQQGCADGNYPQAGVVFDSSNNLYGTTYAGGAQGSGVLFKLNQLWQIDILHSFCSLQSCNDGAQPAAGVIQDPQGYLYGTVSTRGPHVAGAVFRYP